MLITSVSISRVRVDVALRPAVISSTVFLDSGGPL